MSKGNIATSVDLVLETVILLDERYKYYIEKSKSNHDIKELNRITVLISELLFYTTSASNLSNRFKDALRQLQWAQNQTGYLLFLIKLYKGGGVIDQLKINEFKELIIYIDKMIEDLIN